jgi:hypothetical protein
VSKSSLKSMKKITPCFELILHTKRYLALTNNSMDRHLKNH